MILIIYQVLVKGQTTRILSLLLPEPVRFCLFGFIFPTEFYGQIGLESRSLPAGRIGSTAKSMTSDTCQNDDDNRKVYICWLFYPKVAPFSVVPFYSVLLSLPFLLRSVSRALTNMWTKYVTFGHQLLYFTNPV